MKQLRKSLRAAALLLCLVMLLPMGYGAYSLLRYGTRWRTSEYNVYLTSMKSNVVAGRILDRNGVLLAETQLDDSGATRRVYARDESVRRAMVHAVGDTANRVKNAVESFFAEYLYGAHMGYLERLNQLRESGALHGDDVTLTLDSALSAYIASIFPANRAGAAVVMNYRTGELYALMSFPSYDPMSGAAVSVSQALNRATRWLSAPGSTFKIVTLSAALENLPGAASQTYLCTGGVTFGEHERFVVDYGGEAHGELTLRGAFSASCNSTFAILASQMGDRTLRRMAESFGVGDDFTFRDLVVENSAFASTDAALLGAALAWTGVGQNELAITPLHMCMIAAAVANEGRMMEPRLLLRAVSAAGAERAVFEPALYRTALRADTAALVRDYMRAVVTSGTGSAAAVPGLQVCAKTGTAEMDTQERDNAWFVGFLNEEAYPFALCIAIEEGGTGGSAAAPIAQKIFRYLTGK